MNYRDSIQKIIYQIIDRPLEALLKRGVTPNQVTFIGFLGNVIAAVCIGKGHPGWGVCCSFSSAFSTWPTDEWPAKAV